MVHRHFSLVGQYFSILLLVGQKSPWKHDFEDCFMTGLSGMTSWYLIKPSWASCHEQRNDFTIFRLSLLCKINMGHLREFLSPLLHCASLLSPLFCCLKHQYVPVGRGTWPMRRLVGYGRKVFSCTSTTSTTTTHKLTKGVQTHQFWPRFAVGSM